MLCSLLNSYSIYSMNQQCYLEKLPLELHGKIIENVFNLKCDLKNDIRKKFLTVHLLLGCKFVDEFCEIEKLCKKRIFIHNDLGMPSLTRVIFSLSKEEVRALSAAANPRFLDYDTIDKDIYNIIANIKNKDITKGFCLNVASRDRRVKIYLKTRAIARGCLLMGDGTYSGAVVIDGLLRDHYELKKHPFFSIIIIGGIIVIGIGVALWAVSGAILCESSEETGSYKEKIYIKTKKL